MTKDDIADAIASKLAIAKKDAGEALNIVLEEITKTLSKGGEVTLTGFGTFRVSRRKAREGINPQTKERITIPEMSLPKFTAGKALKEAVK